MPQRVACSNAPISRRKMVYVTIAAMFSTRMNAIKTCGAGGSIECLPRASGPLEAEAEIREASPIIACPA